jgi:hypothetical protein
MFLINFVFLKRCINSIRSATSIKPVDWLVLNRTTEVNPSVITRHRHEINEMAILAMNLTTDFLI